MEFSLAHQVVVPSNVLLQEIQGEAVLLNADSGRYFGLDEVGTRMWAALTATDSIEKAYDSLLATYDVEAERLREDIQVLIAKLVENGLVEVHEI